MIPPKSLPLRNFPPHRKWFNWWLQIQHRDTSDSTNPTNLETAHDRHSQGTLPITMAVSKEWPKHTSVGWPPSNPTWLSWYKHSWFHIKKANTNSQQPRNRTNNTSIKNLPTSSWGVCLYQSGIPRNSRKCSLDLWHCDGLVWTREYPFQINSSAQKVRALKNVVDASLEIWTTYFRPTY